MTIRIGENIRHLRVTKNLTQEDLAEFLGVSFQAVSKWERGLAYPDITALPLIADLFSVTVDDLLGTSRTGIDQKITAILAEYDSLLGRADPGADAKKNALAKAAYEEFPHDWRVIDLYRHSLVCGRDAKDYGDTKPTIRRLCEKILSGCPDESIRQRAVSSLLRISETPEEEETYLNMLVDDFCILRGEMAEEIATDKGRREDAARLVRMNIREYFSWFVFKTQGLAEGAFPYDTLSPEERIRVIDKVTAMMELFFEDGDFGGFTNFQIALTEEKARICFRTGDLPTGLAALTESVNHILRANAFPREETHTSVLVRGLTETYPEAYEVNDTPSVERYINRLEHGPAYDTVRETEEFRENLARLKNALPK